MPRVMHFEIHAEDPDRAATFYTGLFGWEIKRWEGAEYWLITTGDTNAPGINGGMVRRRGEIDGQAVIAYVCTIDVDSMDETLQKAVLLGGTIALPKMPVPGIGWLAYARDTEGNVFGMMQMDQTATTPA